MLKNKLTKRFKKMAFITVLLMVFPMLFLGACLFVFPEMMREILILAGLFLLLYMLIFTMLINRFNESLRGMKVSVHDIDKSLPFPKRLNIDKISTFKSSFTAYGYKNIQIPKSFIQSRVDFHYHLYPVLEKINEINEYKLIDVSKFKYALIEDTNKKRWISSFQYLEESQS